MGAHKGHPMWGEPRRPKKLTPDELWEAALNYFKWCIDNPLFEIEQTKMPQRLPANYNKKAHGPIKNFTSQITEIPHARAFTIEGLCLFVGIDMQTYYNYASNKETYKTYFDICARIKLVIDTQHLENGMVGIFNAGLVARKLGLADKLNSDLNIIFPKIEVKDEATKQNVEKLINGE